MTDLPRYSFFDNAEHYDCDPDDNGDWVKWADVSVRLQQLEAEKAALQKAALRVMNCDCLICCACSGELEAATGEKATEDFDWRPVDRSKWEITYSKEVEERIAKSDAALAETRAALQKLQNKIHEDFEAFLSRVERERLSGATGTTAQSSTGEK